MTENATVPLHEAQRILSQGSCDSSLEHFPLAWPAPENSKNAVRKAGKLIAEAGEENPFKWNVTIDPNIYRTVENWRASHGAVLNTAQGWLRGLQKTDSPVFGQRQNSSFTNRA